MSDIKAQAQVLFKKLTEKRFLSNVGSIDISKEVVPYKTWEDIGSFLTLIVQDSLPSWMEDVEDLQLPTSYCYRYSDILKTGAEAFTRRTVPKTMLCHDYKGGYLEDRFVDYNWNDHPNLYGFSQWHLIDSFVYFSHYFVTVPPPCWINASHAHGVPILGTVITEGKDGVFLTDQFLENEAAATQFADILILINNVHKFDGYLINIENNLTPPQVPVLRTFLRYLRQNLPSNSQVIWYDSVTDDGSLHWQNSLNHRNEGFFDACDGIYLNYNYRKWELELSALRAGDRKHDVYVGVDVFGRGCPGSGFSCGDAASMIRENDLSMAVFAPGWTKESVPGSPLLNDRIFWSTLSPYLYVHGNGSSAKTKYLLGGNISPDSNCNSLIKRKNLMFLWTGVESQIVLALLPPIVTEKDRRTIIKMHEQVVTFKTNDISQYYQMLPTPMLDKTKANTLWINTDGEKNDQKIPLMFMEQPINGMLDISLEACGVADKNGILFIYVSMQENPFETPKRTKFPVNLDPDTWKSTNAYLEGKGVVLELGFIASPHCRVNVQMLKIRVIDK